MVWGQNLSWTRNAPVAVLAGLDEGKGARYVCGERTEMGLLARPSGTQPVLKDVGTQEWSGIIDVDVEVRLDACGTGMVEIRFWGGVLLAVDRGHVHRCPSPGVPRTYAVLTMTMDSGATGQGLRRSNLLVDVVCENLG